MGRIGILLATGLLLAPLPAQAQSAAGSYAPEMTRIEQGKPRGAKPLRRDKFDDAVAKLFAAGDSNHDGTITLAEFNTVIAAGRDRAIRDRFAAIDGDRNQSLSLAEFAAWQGTMGSTVLADGPEAKGGVLVVEQIGIDVGNSDEDILVERVLQPLTATGLVEANQDYDAGVTLAELIAWEGLAFAKVDVNNDNFVVPDELVDAFPRGAPEGN